MTDTQQSPIGMQLIQAERARQIKAEGWTDRHDNQFDVGVLEAAGEYYIQGGAEGCKWPFENPPKLKDRRSNYIRGGALLMAEVDRIQRRIYPNTYSFDVRNRDSEGVMRLRERIQWVADRLDGKTEETVNVWSVKLYSYACAFIVATWQEVLEHLSEHSEYVEDSNIKKISIKKINMNKADFETLPVGWTMTYEESEALTREHLDRAAKEVGVTWQQTSFHKGETVEVAVASWGRAQPSTKKINCPPYIGTAITYGPDTFQLGLASTNLDTKIPHRNIGRGLNPNIGIIKQFCDAFERVI